MTHSSRVLLDEAAMPQHWYNILPDLDFEVPTERRARLAADSVSQDRIVPQIPLTMFRQGHNRATDRIEIPERVREAYRRWRPTPLYRAHGLERALGTPAHIYYKYEGTNASGSHKLNSALAQVHYYHEAGIRELTTGTGAGQWGTALAMACREYGMRCTIFMVGVSYAQKPYRRVLMQSFGADVIPSPSTRTRPGREELERRPESSGSLSIANAEAIEYALSHPDCRFSIGSGENHVLLHQTVIGEEALLQMRQVGEYPDVVIAAMGAGSNFAGLAFPFHREKVREGRQTRLVAVEPAACPKLTRGRYEWDYNDYSGITPMTKMYTLGHTYMSPGIHAGGLRYHGAAPIVSAMYHHGLLEAVAYPQRTVFEAGLQFMHAEGLVPAPESAHAVRCAIDEALRAKEQDRPTVILLNVSGHGLLDLSAYDQYLRGELDDHVATDEAIEASLGRLPGSAEVGV